MAVKKEEKEEQHLLGSELRDAIAASITRCQPNVQWKALSRLVNEVEVELKHWRELQISGGNE